MKLNTGGMKTLILKSVFYSEKNTLQRTSVMHIEITTNLKKLVLV